MRLQSRGRWEKWVSDWGISTPDASFLARESRPDLPRRGSTCGSRDWGLLPDKEPESKGPPRGQVKPWRTADPTTEMSSSGTST
ncbi:hypothetical protein BHM03_00031076 [Ensete ventricosum]|nr:hypothetical protein BHM03_00031076 [Ensete ventricosum]